MEINVTLPFDQLEHPEFLTPEAVERIATLVERVGFSGCNVTDHPCPSGKWLDAGGHHAQDPFVMLALVAGMTRRVRLQTGILVLPYRNPFITARAVSTLDVFSGGRVTLGIGVGYLKAEYYALGVDFERRNALVDEYLQALKLAWTQDEFSFKGSGYEARGARVQPRPVQKPHPPLLIGGNSRLAMRRAATYGDAWYPFFTPATMASTARTAAMETDSDLAAGIRYLHEHCEKIGRATPPEVRLGSLSAVDDAMDPQRILDRAGSLSGLGVRHAAVNVVATSVQQWCDRAQRFAEEVMPRLPR